MMSGPDPQSIEIANVLPKGFDLVEHGWVFGYGSLMWRPDFDFAVAVPARLHGWHRQFTLLSVKAWGTPEKPGLSAALHPGGSVLGVAFAVSRDNWSKTRAALDRREAAYLPRTVACLHNEHRIEALTYVVHPTNGRFLETPSFDLQARHIRQGDGPRGTSLEYLEKTVGMLEEMGSFATRAHALLDHVQQSCQIASMNARKIAFAGWSSP